MAIIGVGNVALDCARVLAKGEMTAPNASAGSTHLEILRRGHAVLLEHKNVASLGYEGYST